MRMIPKVDLVIGEIPKFVKSRDGKTVPNPDYPSDGMCKTGHAVPGARFFAVSGHTLPLASHGIYCDACIAVANKLAARKKDLADK